MKKVVIFVFVSQDGVMQAPGGPTEDTSSNFTLGGWKVPYFDEFLGQIMTEQTGKPFDLPVTLLQIPLQPMSRVRRFF